MQSEYKKLVLEEEKLKEEEHQELLKAYETMRKFLEKIVLLAAINEHNSIKSRANGLKFTLTHGLKELMLEVVKHKDDFFEERL